MRFALASLLLALLTGCHSGDHFLQKPPDPPPAPPRYTKVHKMEVGTNELSAVDVDIIWMIDNSGSMGDDQQRVMANSASFMHQFIINSKLHWRMGLISCGVSEAPYMGFDSIVDWQTTDAEGQFNAAVARLGTRDPEDEKTFDPVLKVLRQYPNWHRPGAHLAVTAVSDEPEQSPTTVDQFLGQVGQIMGGALDKFTVFGVLTADSNSYNTKYREVIRRTHGKEYDLLSNDFGMMLSQLGSDLITRTLTLNPVILLDQKPVPDTIQVVYRGRVLRPGAREQGGEWGYDPVYNRIILYNRNTIDTSVLDITVSYVIDDPSTWGI